MYGRQLIWNGGAVAGLVTFSPWLRHSPGFYEGWGSLLRLPVPVTREVLLADPRTADRFGTRGIRGFQGSPIHLESECARAICELAGGIAPTVIPLDEPFGDEEFILWAGLDGLGPEAPVEAAVAARRSLWSKLGFPFAPERQRRLGAVGRVDLIAGDVLGEAKRAVTVANGPDQIERYLRHMRDVKGRPTGRLRGVLLQVADTTSHEVLDRLEASPFSLELWSLTERRGWRATRLS
jgi:hypothetical protein